MVFYTLSQRHWAISLGLMFVMMVMVVTLGSVRQGFLLVSVLPMIMIVVFRVVFVMLWVFHSVPMCVVDIPVRAMLC